MQTRLLRCSRLTPAYWPQLGERSSRPSASQYSMQDLEVSNDTSDSFGGACCAAGRLVSRFDDTLLVKPALQLSPSE